MRRASFAEGEYIVRQGETSPIFCLVQEGTVSVLKQAEGEQEVEGPPYPSPLTRPSEPLAPTALAPRAGGGGPARGGPVLRRGGPQGRRAALGQLQGLRRASQAAHDHAAEDGGATSARSRPPPPPAPAPAPSISARPRGRTCSASSSSCSRLSSRRRCCSSRRGCRGSRSTREGGWQRASRRHELSAALPRSPPRAPR